MLGNALAGLQGTPSKRLLRRLLVGTALGLIVLVLYLARHALTPFFVGLVFAYLLLPPVRFIEVRLPLPLPQARVVSIVVVYVLALGAVVTVATLTLPTLLDQLSRFISLIPDILQQAQEAFQGWAAEFQAAAPPDIERQLEEALAATGHSLVSNAQGVLLGMVIVVSQTFSLLLGYLSIPAWLFYVLKDRSRITRALYRILPSQVQSDVTAVLHIINGVLSSYVRAQLLLGLVVGVLSAIGLSLLGIQFGLVLALIAGVTEMIPVLGPILGALVALVVTLATDPSKFVWVLLLFFLVQQVENNLLVPRIQGQAVSLHPALIMMLLVIASELAGFVGMLVVVPLTAVARDVFLYLYHRFDEEEAAAS